MRPLNDGWLLQSSAHVVEDGAILSTPAADTRGWHRVALPATVLGALVDGGVYPDPFHGMNLRDLPGQGPPAQNFSNHPMPPDSPFAVPWWFRRELPIPAGAGPHLRLRLDGINYRAHVWLNGRQVGEPLVGAYRIFELDVTDLVDRDGVNVLAIEVAAPGPCDLAITWVDWNPSPPDKNMGLWRDVWLLDSGPVALRAPFVTTRLDGDIAHLTVAGDLVNLTARPVTATVHAELQGRRLSARLELAPRETRALAMPLEVASPRLWWPRALGEPALHPVAIEVVVDDARSDRAAFDFGIREITSRLTEHGHTLFEVNGRPMLIRGAGWAPDLFLRRQPAREVAQLEYLKAMNLDTVRFEGMIERAEVLEWCDREGILVIAGWCCCDCWEKWDRWGDENHAVAPESLRSQLERVRRHPSMLTWWYGSDFPPPPRVERAYLEVLAETRWPNPHQSSAANKPTEVTGPSGLKMEGPYEYVPPNYWLEDTARGGAFGFATEISPGVAIPPIETLRRWLTEEQLWPIGEAWAFHAGGQEFHTVQRFVDALAARYGAPTGVEDLAAWSQVMTYEGQRAMFEAYTRNRYRATGVIQWMLNNAWPSMIWHLFDHDLRPGGGFFGTQKACEPLHVMYSYDDRTVVVTNRAARGVDRLTVRARIHEGPIHTAHGVSVPADGKVTALTLPPLEREVTLLDLRLEHDGALVSSNFYWLPRTPDVIDYPKGIWMHTPTAEHADLSALRRLPSTQLAVRASRDHGVRVELENPTDRLAFFVQLRLADASGADVLPVVWTDNYVSLLPGDTRTLSAVAPDGNRLPHEVRVEVTGLNVATVSVAVAPDGERRAAGGLR